MKLVIHVPDISCDHCKMRIEESLRKEPEIRSVSVDLPGKNVVVETDLPEETVLKMIQEIGYHPE